MKLQIAHQELRVRIDSNELDALLGGGSISLKTQFGTAFSLRCELSLVTQPSAAISGSAGQWCIELPREQVGELAARQPTRDGLRFDLAGAEDGDVLNLLFDVDVRDAARKLKRSRDMTS